MSQLEHYTRKISRWELRDGMWNVYWRIRVVRHVAAIGVGLF